MPGSRDAPKQQGNNLWSSSEEESVAEDVESIVSEKRALMQSTEETTKDSLDEVRAKRVAELLDVPGRLLSW